MAKIQDVDIPHLEFSEAAAPGTPASGIVRLYAKSDGLLYSKDDAGSEIAVSGAGTAGPVLACELDDATHTPAGAGEEAVSFGTEVRDDGGFFSAGSPTRLTIPSTGWYLVTGTVSCVSASSTDSYMITIRLNGATYLARTRHYETTNAVAWHQSLSTIHYFTAADYVELTVIFAAEAVTSKFAIAAIGQT